MVDRCLYRLQEKGVTASGCGQGLVASVVLYELQNCLKYHQGAAGHNDDEDGNQKEAQDQGTDGGVALGPDKSPTIFQSLDSTEKANATKPRQHQFMKMVLNRDQTMWSGTEVWLRMLITEVFMGAWLSGTASTATSCSSLSIS